jgi:hypothetical protein
MNALFAPLPRARQPANVVSTAKGILLALEPLLSFLAAVLMAL